MANLWAPDPCGSDPKDSSALPLQCSATISFNLAVLVSFQGPRKDTFISQVAPTQKALFYARLTFSPYHPTLCSCPHLPFPSIGCCHRNTVTQRQLSVGELSCSRATPLLAVTEGQFSTSAHHLHCLLPILLPSMLRLSFGSCRCVECGEHHSIFLCLVVVKRMGKSST